MGRATGDDTRDEQRRAALAHYPAHKIRRFALGEEDPRVTAAKSQHVRNIRSKSKTHVQRSMNRKATWHAGGDS